MSDIEAFLIFFAYILPFGGMIHIIWGIEIGNNSKIIFGVIGVLFALFVMGSLLYQSSKEKRILSKSAKKKKLLIVMFRHIVASCILMIVEFLMLRLIGVQIRHTIPIICISLVIMTAIFTNFKKI